MAAVTTSPVSPSSSTTSRSSCLNRSLVLPRFHRMSVKIPVSGGTLSKRLKISVNCNDPNSDSVIADPNVSEFGHGSGSKNPTHFPSDHGGQASASSPSSAIDFLTLCHRLKTTKRKGWVNHGIKGPESIADHMYLMSLMALIVGDLPGVNRERCIKIAIVHDIAEAIVGDITPSDGVPKAEKSRREQAALNEMCEILGGGIRAEEIKELWEEYEHNTSMEANLVKDFDKNILSIDAKEVEMILQALEYEAEHGKVLDEFFFLLLANSKLK